MQVTVLPFLLCLLCSCGPVSVPALQSLAGLPACLAFCSVRVLSAHDLGAFSETTKKGVTVGP